MVFEKIAGFALFVFIFDKVSAFGDVLSWAALLIVIGLLTIGHYYVSGHCAKLRLEIEAANSGITEESDKIKTTKDRLKSLTAEYRKLEKEEEE